MRRTLWEMLVDVLGGVDVDDGSLAQVLRVSRLSLDVPVEVAVLDRGGEIELAVDLPRWRWTTFFDQPTSRLRIVWGEVDG